jgi:hypothetical protein
MTIQILSYEFLGPIRLSEWGPPMDEVIYLLLVRIRDTFQIIYADESGKTSAADFFTKNEKFKCWLQNAGTEDNLYLSIYPMWGSAPQERQRILQKIIARFQPPCNNSNDSNMSQTPEKT